MEEDSKIKLYVLGITFGQVQAGAYALLLAEENGARKIPIIIGTPEAQSITLFLEGSNPPRPLTHDLFIKFMDKMDAVLTEIFIYQFADGIFYSELVFYKDNKYIKMDSRTSDAIALAVRANAPIFTTETIMQVAGDFIEEEDGFENIERGEQAITMQQRSLENSSEKELQKALNEAISMEDYEKASKIRDLLNKKKEA